MGAARAGAADRSSVCDRGRETDRVSRKRNRTLASGLPPFVGFSWSPQDVFTVLPSAFTLAFVTSVNILITSRVVEHFRGGTSA